MCTAVSFKTKNHYFGRNLDLEFSYHETVTVTPRKKQFSFRHLGVIKEHPAMIGMAYVVNDYPLYYEASNEYGVSIAGLNFPENAHYNSPMDMYHEDLDGDHVVIYELVKGQQIRWEN